jgi:hypothetical protein
MLLFPIALATNIGAIPNLVNSLACSEFGETMGTEISPLWVFKYILLVCLYDGSKNWATTAGVGSSLV